MRLKTLCCCRCLLKLAYLSPYSLIAPKVSAKRYMPTVVKKKKWILLHVVSLLNRKMQPYTFWIQDHLILIAKNASFKLDINRTKLTNTVFVWLSTITISPQFIEWDLTIFWLYQTFFLSKKGLLPQSSSCPSGDVLTP